MRLLKCVRPMLVKPIRRNFASEEQSSLLGTKELKRMKRNIDEGKMNPFEPL